MTEQWIRVKKDDPWYTTDRIGICGHFQDGQLPLWYARNGKIWEGANAIAEDFVNMGMFEKCTEEEAKQALRGEA